MGELVGVVNLPWRELVARHTERIKGGFLDKLAAGIGNGAGGAKVVLVIIADAQRWVGDYQRSGSGRLDIKSLPGGQRGRWTRDGGQATGKVIRPLPGRGVEAPARRGVGQAERPGLQARSGNIRPAWLKRLNHRLRVAAENGHDRIGAGLEPENRPCGQHLAHRNRRVISGP